MAARAADVDQYIAMTLSFIDAARSYAGAGVYDADTDAKIRELRVATSALQTALNQIMITRPVEPPVMPAMPAPPAPAAAPAAPEQPAGRRS
jgi:hypothetical protein